MTRRRSVTHSSWLEMHMYPYNRGDLSLTLSILYCTGFSILNTHLFDPKPYQRSEVWKSWPTRFMVPVATQKGSRTNDFKIISNSSNRTHEKLYSSYNIHTTSSKDTSERLSRLWNFSEPCRTTDKTPHN